MGKRDPHDEQRGRERYPWLIAFVIILMGVLAIRLLTLQFFEYDYYAQYAQENQLQRERIMAPLAWLSWFGRLGIRFGRRVGRRTRR